VRIKEASVILSPIHQKKRKIFFPLKSVKFVRERISSGHKRNRLKIVCWKKNYLFRLKTNMEAAEERGDELQRLLDASRAAESQSRCQLRLLQQQRHQQQQLLLIQEEEQCHPLEEFATAMGSISVHQENQIHHPTSYCPTGGNQSRRIQMEDTMTVCRLVDDLAEVEERLHLMETDWMEEKRKRMQLETEVMALQQENQRLHEQLTTSASGSNSSHSSSSASIGCDPSSLSPAPASLSLSEELLISSTTDFSSAQWRDAWDNSGPISLIGAGIIRNKLCNNEDEELCSDSSSSGFSEENQRSSVAKATQTDLADLPTSCTTIATTTSSDWADVRSLFREIFAVIQQNI
jgi:hypothetical protein